MDENRDVLGSIDQLGAGPCVPRIGEAPAAAAGHDKAESLCAVQHAHALQARDAQIFFGLVQLRNLGPVPPTDLPQF